jgi:allantoin racemase
MKLMLSDPIPALPGKPHWAWYQRTIEAVARPGTIVDLTHLPEGYFRMLTGAYAAAYNAIGMIQNAYRAERGGYDAFLIGCTDDLGLRAARALLSIPVLAPTESAVHLASMLGNKFSIIAFRPESCGIVKNQIDEYRLGDKLASVRCPPAFTEQSSFELMFGGGEGQRKFVELVTEEMSKAVKEDGAEALIVGCTIGAALLTMHGVHDIDGAPVIDPVAAEIKMAETLVDLRTVYGTGVCKASIYAGPLPGWEKEVPIKVEQG